MLFRFWPRSVSELFNSRGLLRVLGVFLESTTGLGRNRFDDFFASWKLLGYDGLSSAFHGGRFGDFLGCLRLLFGCHTPGCEGQGEGEAEGQCSHVGLYGNVCPGP